MRILLILLVTLGGFAAEPSPADHVVILVLDGARWSETWGRPERDLIPVRAKRLAPLGTLFTNAANTGATVTEPGHIALCTGFLQKTSNSGVDTPANPSWLQRYLAASHADPADAWIITSKDKLAMLGNTSQKDWSGKALPNLDCGVGGRGLRSGYREDQATVERVKEVLAAHQPRALVINLRSPDYEGHGGNLAEYLEAIRRTDRQAGEIYDAIQAQPKMKGRTLLMITNDHGRHLDGIATGFKDHGCDCAGCRHVELLAVGPGVQAGAVVQRSVSLLDMAVSAAAVVEVKIPGSTGVVMPELVGPRL